MGQINTLMLSDLGQVSTKHRYVFRIKLLNKDTNHSNYNYRQDKKSIRVKKTEIFIQVITPI